MLNLPTFDEAKSFKQLFDQTEYHAKGLMIRLGTLDPPVPQLRNLPRFIERSRQDNPLNLLIRWFFIDQPVAKTLAHRYLPKWFLDQALELGMLRSQGENLLSTLLLVPYKSLLVASDPYRMLASSDSYDHVLTINPTTEFLLNFTLRKPMENVLDLGAGCGIQGLVAASQNKHVIACDLNPRATTYASFNARLNSINNLECLTGDFWAPVQNRRFDLIVCNPPFVLGPSQNYLYRDNALELDLLCRQLVREAPAYLNSGGFFQMVCEWVECKGQRWQQRLAEWFTESPCCTWVRRNVSQSPEDYAHGRLRETIQESPEADQQSFQTWMAYFKQHNVEKIHGGIIALRLTTENPWQSFGEQPDGLQKPFGDEVLQQFQIQDFLHSHPRAEDLLSTKLRLTPEALLEQERRPRVGHWQTSFMRIRQLHGMPSTIQLSEDIAQFIGSFDGNLSVQEHINALSKDVTTDLEHVKSESLQVIRMMIEQGFLLPS